MAGTPNNIEQQCRPILVRCVKVVSTNNQCSHEHLLILPFHIPLAVELMSAIRLVPEEMKRRGLFF